MEQAEMDRINGIHQKLQRLIAESQDPYFTQYLNKLGNQLNEGKVPVDEIEEGLERNLLRYKQRMGMQEQPSTPPEKKKKTDGGMEFKVGTSLLSIVGILFILAAFSVFAVNYMTGLVMGICLYVVAVAVILVSELIIRRHQEKFAHGITGLGIAGLYTATIINYNFLLNFNEITVLIIAGVVTVLTAILGWKKQSGLFRVVSMLGCASSILLIEGIYSPMQFIVLAVIFLVLNGILVLIPEKNNRFSMAVVHLITVICFSFGFIEHAVSSHIQNEYILCYVMLMLLLLNLIFFKQKRDGVNIVAFCCNYGIAIIMALSLAGKNPYYIWFGILLTAVTVIAVFMNRKKEGKWIPYWFFLSALLIHYGVSEEKMTAVICILSLFIITKLFSRIKTLRISECAVTVVAAVMSIAYGDGIYGLCFAGAFLLSCFAIHYWNSFYEIMITLVCLIVAARNIEGSLTLPICVAILICGEFAFNFVKRWRGEKIQVYNICNLIATIILYMMAAPNRNIMTFLILLLFGITYIVFFFTPQTGLPYKYKNLWMVLFLTYMAMVVRLEIPIINSIILILIAGISIGIGFAFKQKNVRIYGLVLSIFVCLKVVLYDLSNIDALQKTILYLAVGGVILIMSYIYMRMEKKMNVEEEEQNPSENIETEVKDTADGHEE